MKKWRCYYSPMFRTLGRLEVDGSSYTSSKPLLLLAYLTYEGHCERSLLAELFFSDSSGPRNALSVTLSRIRKNVPGALEADETQVWSTLESDVQVFLQMLKKGDAQGALELYEGPFLGSTALPNWSSILESWVYDTREDLAGQARTSLLQLAQARAATAQPELAAHYTETAYSLAAAPPLSEEEVQQMLPLLQKVNSPALQPLTAEAKELGLSLSDLALPEPQPVVTEAAPVSAPSALTPNNLPVAASSFIGREAELAVLSAQLSDRYCRLLTLTGLGGIGKSRLSLELARRKLAENTFMGGVYLITLESLQSADLVPTRLARALSLSLNSGENPLELVCRFIADKPTLLVLDNAEHLPALSEMVKTLLESCPKLRLIITSRTRLDVQEEWVFSVGGLPYPEEQGAELMSYDAPELFAQRAKRTLLNYSLHGHEADLLRLCELVGGAPLALELAATWVRTLSLAQICDEVASGFKVLKSNYKDVDERHESILAVLEQSWSGLTREEQTVLSKLSLFEGGFSRTAASEVAGASLLALTKLIDKSFVRQAPHERYDLHPLVKQFAATKLDGGELEQTEKLFAEYFIAFIGEAKTQSQGDEQGKWLGYLERDFDNIGKVFVKAVEEKTITALEILCDLFWFLLAKGMYIEGLAWVKRTLPLIKDTTKFSAPKMEAEVLRQAGGYAHYMGDNASAQSFLEMGLKKIEILPDKALTAKYLYNLGIISLWKSDVTAKKGYLEEALAIHAELDNKIGIALCLSTLGIVETDMGNYLLGETHFQGMIDITRDLNHKRYLAYGLCNMCHLEFTRGMFSDAKRYLDEALQVSQKSGDTRQISYCHLLFGRLHLYQGHYMKARQYFEQELSEQRKAEHIAFVAQALKFMARLTTLEQSYNEAQKYLYEAVQLNAKLHEMHDNFNTLDVSAQLSCALSKFPGAVRIWAKTAMLREAAGNPRYPVDQPQYERDISLAKAKLGQVAFDQAWQEGQAMSLDEITEYVLEEVCKP